MRVTINFDVEVGRARAAMKALVLAESDRISDALVRLSVVNDKNVSEVSAEVSQILNGVTVQLGQYARMLSDLDNLSNKTIVPAPVEDVDLGVSGNDEEELPEDLKNTLSSLRNQVNEMKNFTNFMNKAPDDESYEEG
tara:strand:- start:199 stop:612 length:414 start_codon:yes stop_codon:yes gene_type:complete